MEIVDKIAHVKVEGYSNLVSVPISSKEKPEIDEDFERKWQELVDLAARIIDVPAGLIMRLLETEIEVFRSSHTENNPYEPGEKAGLGLGLYCETVVGKRKELLVPNAAIDDNWKYNPDMELDMVSYYGVPIRWPDGEVFGTFCVLDNKENHYFPDQRALIAKFAELVEKDLEIQHNRNQLVDDIAYKELRLREMRHRIKNQLNMLISYIDLHRSRNDELSFENFSMDMQNRIRTLYSLHNRLTQAIVETTIPLPELLNNISVEISAGVDFDIDIKVDGSETYLDERTVVPVSLILNELITNSIKYAFTKVDKPQISIDCKETDNEVILIYKDNGKSYHSAEETAGGVGTMIIEGLAAQISASIKKDFSNGFLFSMVIPKD